MEALVTMPIVIPQPPSSLAFPIILPAAPLLPLLFTDAPAGPGKRLRLQARPANNRNSRPVAVPATSGTRPVLLPAVPPPLLRGGAMVAPEQKSDFAEEPPVIDGRDGVGLEVDVTLAANQRLLLRFLHGDRKLREVMETCADVSSDGALVFSASGVRVCCAGSMRAQAVEVHIVPNKRDYVFRPQRDSTELRVELDFDALIKILKNVTTGEQIYFSVRNGSDAPPLDVVRVDVLTGARVQASVSQKILPDSDTTQLVFGVADKCVCLAPASLASALSRPSGTACGELCQFASDQKSLYVVRWDTRHSCSTIHRLPIEPATEPPAAADAFSAERQPVAQGIRNRGLPEVQPVHQYSLQLLRYLARTRSWAQKVLLFLSETDTQPLLAYAESVSVRGEVRVWYMVASRVESAENPTPLTLPDIRDSLVHLPLLPELPSAADATAATSGAARRESRVQKRGRKRRKTRRAEQASQEEEEEDDDEDSSYSDP
jgi:hypothetical protein